MKVHESKFQNAVRGKKMMYWGEDDSVIWLPRAVGLCSTHTVCFCSFYIWVTECLWWKMKHQLYFNVIKPLKSLWIKLKIKGKKKVKYMSFWRGFFSSSTWFWWLKLFVMMHRNSNKPNQLAKSCSEEK